VSGSIRPIRRAFSWLNQTPPSARCRFRTAPQHHVGTDGFRVAGSNCPKPTKYGATRTASACPHVRAGRRIVRCSPVFGSIIDTWFETASVYQARPF